jgi:nucleoside 2-deoxyribosyltransferase
MTRLRVYLAGPIRGCNEEQRTWWRNEVKQLLKKDFDFEDPTEWADDFVVSREIAKLEACDILLANMWKESIGTTLGVVRARHQGKPVVLIGTSIASRRPASACASWRPSSITRSWCARGSAPSRPFPPRKWSSRYHSPPRPPG